MTRASVTCAECGKRISRRASPRGQTLRHYLRVGILDHLVEDHALSVRERSSVADRSLRASGII